jgi:hypothetical protein
MVKITPIAVALMLSITAWAGVTIDCSIDGSNRVTISYDASAETELVRAFALDVTVDSGQTINSVVSTNPDYGIYPGSIMIDASGNVTDYGSPIAAQSDYPGDTLGGVGTSGVTIEMASLYAAGETPPAAADDLITLQLSGPGVVTVNENVIRGGVVMEDPQVPANPTLPTQCDAGAGCKGDVNGDQAVNTDDLNLMAVHLFQFGSGEKFQAPIAPYQPSGDISNNGFYDTDDLNLLAVHLFQFGSGEKFDAPCMQ